MQEEALICGQCGGQLEAKEGTFKELEGGGFFYFGSDHLQCKFCKTEYAPNSQVPKFVQVTQTVVADNAIVIGGNVSNSTIIMASGTNTNKVKKRRRE
jgi:hypothetical protein